MTVAKRPTGLDGGRADMKRFAPPPALALPRPADPTLDPGRPALAQLLGWRRCEVSYKGSVTQTVPLSTKLSLQCKVQYSTVQYSTVQYSTEMPQESLETFVIHGIRETLDMLLRNVTGWHSEGHQLTLVDSAPVQR